MEIYDSPSLVATLVVTLIPLGFFPPWVKMAKTSILIDIITCIFILYLNHLYFYHKKQIFFVPNRIKYIYIYIYIPQKVKWIYKRTTCVVNPTSNYTSQPN